MYQHEKATRMPGESESAHLHRLTAGPPRSSESLEDALTKNCPRRYPSWEAALSSQRLEAGSAFQGEDTAGLRALGKTAGQPGGSVKNRVGLQIRLEAGLSFTCDLVNLAVRLEF